ncbi:MAG: hypothetical protein NTU61_03115 [Candidatus Altiarchaeota archaeon]|nr:hypothetical protein [Candidatus Altiarchaeota archaeon]
MVIHRAGEKHHSELSDLPPKLNACWDRISDMESVAMKAFKNPHAVLEEVKNSLRESSNPERILSRYYAIFNTLFKEKVFADNDAAWEKIVRVSRPGLGDWGETPTGTGFAVFGLALRSLKNPEAVLDALISTSSYAPKEAREFALGEIPPGARGLHIMTTVWGNMPGSMAASSGSTFNNYYPDYNTLGNCAKIAEASLNVCQKPAYTMLVRDRVEIGFVEGRGQFDNALLWEAFMKATAETPCLISLLVKHKEEVIAGRAMGSFDRAVMFLDSDAHSASINIAPTPGFMLVEEIGTGHQQMLIDYGINETERGKFLPGAITIRDGKPLFQITGGLAGSPPIEVEKNLNLIANHLLRLGYSPDLCLSAYTGEPDAIESSIGELASGQLNINGIRRERIKVTNVESLANLGERGYLVIDEKNNVQDLQGGSVIVAPVMVLGYCFYIRSGDQVALYNIKAKHFEISSNALNVAERLRQVVKPDEQGRIVATGEYVK